MNNDLKVYLVWAGMIDGSERRASLWAANKSSAKRIARRMFREAVSILVI